MSLRNKHDTSKVFDSWILRKVLYSQVIADLPLQSARPYMKYYSYPNDDTEMATFDLTVPLAMLHSLSMVE